jgi:hypothetical protein
MTKGEREKKGIDDKRRERENEKERRVKGIDDKRRERERSRRKGENKG